MGHYYSLLCSPAECRWSNHVHLSLLSATRSEDGKVTAVKLTSWCRSALRWSASRAGEPGWSAFCDIAVPVCCCCCCCWWCLRWRRWRWVFPLDFPCSSRRPPVLTSSYQRHCMSIIYVSQWKTRLHNSSHLTWPHCIWTKLETVCCPVQFSSDEMSDVIVFSHLDANRWTCPAICNMHPALRHMCGNKGCVSPWHNIYLIQI